MAKKTSKKRASKRTTRKKKRTARSAAGSLRTVGVQELQRELSKRVARLESRRERLLDELAEIDRELGTLGSESGSRKRSGRRARNSQTLEEALASLLSGKTMGVSEAAEAVQAAGYVSNAENFRTIVNQTLIRSKLFKKVSRGQYTAK